MENRSAGKRAEEIRDIPASVTILTREEIERYGWLTLEEVLRSAPGCFILDNIEERFIGTRGAVGGGVQFLVNGVAQHPSQQKTLTVPEIARLNVPVEAIDRIEIIRGPMSVIYGNNAFLGGVNIITNDVAGNGSRVSASLGTRGTGAPTERSMPCSAIGCSTSARSAIAPTSYPWWTPRIHWSPTPSTACSRRSAGRRGTACGWWAVRA